MKAAAKSLLGTGILGILLLASGHGLAASSSSKIVHLTCDSLIQPMGIDTRQPAFSWQLTDAGFGARQTAYHIEVATKPTLLATDKPDVWDSGVVKSDRSVDVLYRGPALAGQQRYYWRVMVWDKNGKPYPVSDVTWWETGLMEAAWKAKWIGFEDQENRSVRESGARWITNVIDQSHKGHGDTQHDFRFSFDVAKPVKRAVLYVTGRETAAAWVNGRQVLQSLPLPPWKEAPWQTYLRKDVSTELHSGTNLLAIAVTLYDQNPNDPGVVEDNRTPMSACLYLEMADGSVQVLKSGKGWKAALNAHGEWQAEKYTDTAWKDAISYEQAGDPWPTGPVKMLRREFEVSKPVRSARLYVTALGAYQFQCNGVRAGTQVLAPGWMDFRIHVPYQVYDVTASLAQGKNAMGAYLAPGWYTTPLKGSRQGYNYGDTPPALKAQLRIAYSDGSVEWIVSDESWRADVSPMLQAEIYDGETYDARLEQKGWDTPQFSDAQWKPVNVIHPLEPAIVAQTFEPIRAHQVLTAKEVSNPVAGVYIFDFGQNLSGVARLRVQGAAGTDVQLRFAEVLNADGTLYVDNLRTAKATDHYILSGKGVEEYQATFTFHGFRYVEMTGSPSRPAADAVQAVVLHTDAPFTAQLHTGSAMVNQLWSNILWGQRSNFVGVPTDCPQRDERLGWSADAQVFWRAASYNMGLTQFSKKYAADLRGTQTGTAMYGFYAPGTNSPTPGFAAAWSDAGVIIPWTAWLQSGDTRVIEQNWSAMEKYLDAIQAANPEYIWKNSGTPFGDWLSPEGKTVQTLIASAYWAYDVSLMQQMAHALGKADDEKKYADLFVNIKAAFVKAFVHADGFVAGADNSASPFGQINNPDARSGGGDTQTGYVLALEMNLLPDALRAAAAEKLVGKIKANHWLLGTGFLGTPYLLAVLVDTGHTDVAYRLLLNTEYPSWGYLVGHGATTMWERWNGDQMRHDPSMNSYNHYAYGAVADWIYRYAAGIDALPSDPGFHTIYLHPNFDSRLGSLDFAYMSPYGEVKSSWSMKGPVVAWTVTIPPNTTARLPVPERADAFTIDGKKLSDAAHISLVRGEQGIRMYQFEAGTYSLKVANPSNPQ